MAPASHDSVTLWHCTYFRFLVTGPRTVRVMSLGGRLTTPLAAFTLVPKLHYLVSGDGTSRIA